MTTSLDTITGSTLTTIQTTCPAWCISTDHDDLAPLPERWHQSDPECVDVVSEPPFEFGGRWHTSYLTLHLFHTFSHSAPTIDLVVPNRDACDRSVQLTIDEAVTLADALRRLAGSAGA